MTGVQTCALPIWALASNVRFVYDGWTLLAVLDSTNGLLQSFTWGLDASGSMQGAGGVGGLLSMTVHTGTNAGSYFYAYDGNYNVTALLNATNSAVAARYEYGPFGEVIRATGPTANVTPFRFSTEYYDDETGIIIYPHRPYSPSTGRFLSRDPLGEASFLHGAIQRDRKHSPELCRESLGPGYVFVSNRPVDHIDPMGLNVYKVTSTKLCSTPLHRLIVGDDGNGGAYTLEVFGKKCWYSIGAMGYNLIARGNVSWGHAQQSAEDYINEQGYNIVATVETTGVYFYPASNGSVDYHLAKDALNEDSGSFGIYVFLLSDCGSYANYWLSHAKEVLQQAEASCPGLE